MTIQYKNKGISLVTTNTVDVLTSPANARLLVKQIQLSNEDVGGLAVTVEVRDISEPATYRISNKSIGASSTTDVVINTLVLEESDVLKMTCGTINKIQGIISYAQIDRSQENG